MRLTSILTAMMASTVFALPMQSSTQDPSAKLLHPAVSALTDCTTALSNVVPEIRAFDGKEWDARRLEIDAINAVNLLNNATNQILTQPDIDYMTALQFLPVAPALFTGAYSLVNALNEKKAVLQSTPDFARRTLNVLEATNAGVKSLVAAFDLKLPSAVSFILKGLDSDIVSKIQATRDQYTVISTPLPAVNGGVGAAPVAVTSPPAAYPVYQPYQPAQPAQPQQPQPQYPQYQPYAPAQSQPSDWNTQAQPQYQAVQPQYASYQPVGMEPARH